VAQRGRRHVDGARVGETVFVHEPDPIGAGGAPNPGTGRDGHSQLASHLEGGPLGEARVTVDIESQLEAQHVLARWDPPLTKSASSGLVDHSQGAAWTLP
jgi:hypothetical protein